MNRITEDEKSRMILEIYEDTNLINMTIRDMYMYGVGVGTAMERAAPTVKNEEDEDE